MRLVCVSDTHTYGSQITVPDGDVLIHAGDHTFRGTEGETVAALRWLEGLPHSRKLLVAGNHDFWFDHRFPSGHRFRNWKIQRTMRTPELINQFPSLTYLEDSGVEIDGISFWGSPWQPWYYDWAFQFNHPQYGGNEEAAKKWGEIPDSTQVLVTHGPPSGILDRAHDESKQGCAYLRRRVEELPQLAVHVFGHMHESYGETVHNGVRFVNAAINDIEYEPVNAPIVIDL